MLDFLHANWDDGVPLSFIHGVAAALSVMEQVGQVLEDRRISQNPLWKATLQATGQGMGAPRKAPELPVAELRIDSGRC